MGYPGLGQWACLPKVLKDDICWRFLNLKLWRWSKISVEFITMISNLIVLAVLWCPEIGHSVLRWESLHLFLNSHLRNQNNTPYPPPHVRHLENRFTLCSALFQSPGYPIHSPGLYTIGGLSTIAINQVAWRTLSKSKQWRNKHIFHFHFVTFEITRGHCLVWLTGKDKFIKWWSFFSITPQLWFV